jgi:6-phosphofructokinase 1
VPHLAETLPELQQNYLNSSRANSASSHGDNWAYNKIMSSEDVILGDIRRNPNLSGGARAYLRAGPRKECYFVPSEVRAAIVTCGGLCPGLNNVIRDITLALFHLYGVKYVYGVRGGYAGFHFKGRCIFLGAMAFNLFA